MALPTQLIDTQGNVEVADAQRLSFDAVGNVRLAGTSQPYVVVVSATPNAVLTAPKGSMALNINGSSTSTRAFINTDGGTTWTAVTTAA